MNYQSQQNFFRERFSVSATRFGHPGHLQVIQPHMEYVGGN